jgi:hypothetical protein
VAYGFVGYLQGLPVFTDANIRTNVGGGSNEDRILIFASQVVQLWERPDDPMTLAFEQQAGTSLEVQLVTYGYRSEMPPQGPVPVYTETLGRDWLLATRLMEGHPATGRTEGHLVEHQPVEKMA